MNITLYICLPRRGQYGKLGPGTLVSKGIDWWKKLLTQPSLSPRTVVSLISLHHITHHMCRSNRTWSTPVPHSEENNSKGLKLFGMYHPSRCWDTVFAGSVTIIFGPWAVGWIPSQGPLTRYAKLRVAHAQGMPEMFFPPLRVSDPTCIPAPACRTCRDACRDG